MTGGKGLGGVARRCGRRSRREVPGKQVRQWRIHKARAVGQRQRVAAWMPTREMTVGGRKSRQAHRHQQGTETSSRRAETHGRGGWGTGERGPGSDRRHQHQKASEAANTKGGSKAEPASQNAGRLDESKQLPQVLRRRGGFGTSLRSPVANGEGLEGRQRAGLPSCEWCTAGQRRSCAGRIMQEGGHVTGCVIAQRESWWNGHQVPSLSTLPIDC